jgi:hypothetical protein
MRATKFFLTLQFAVFFLPIYSQTTSTPIESFQQKNDARKGYIVTKNNEYKGGFVFVEKIKGNAESVLFYESIQGQPVRYDKNSVIEFGNDKDEIYVLMDIEGNQVFLEKLNLNEPFIFYYNSKESKSFYYKKGDELVLIPRDTKNFGEELKNMAQNCEEVEDIIKLVNYNKISLPAYSSRLNDCSNKKIPYLKGGVFVSAQLHKFTLENDYFFVFYAIELEGIHHLYISKENYTPQYNLSYGVFFDIPVFKNNLNFTFHPEFEFSAIKYEFKEEVASVIIDLNYLNTNMMFRYNNQSHRSSLFVDFGLAYSYLIVNDVHIEFQGANYPTGYQFKNMYGLAFGLGMEYSVFKRNTINVGVKGNYLTSFSQNPTVWNIAPFIGFTF